MSSLEFLKQISQSNNSNKKSKIGCPEREWCKIMSKERKISEKEANKGGKICIKHSKFIIRNIDRW